ncbi:glycoside hydrolase family 16 protein [Neolewinella aurantiaca]|uniref:Glycoside hydrolase family 16 protein n=2 Tax=Neolewinella aurantiaca TaxID=2602767 RepID=A0A5C7FLH0_9BACT|nr:glycoside hydrolase family 16 protein [Neolewinella aurantiaca]
MLSGIIFVLFNLSSCNKWLGKGQNNLELVWADEFKGQEPPNEDKWTYDIGTGSQGWGNDEKEYYTDRAKNVRLLGGKLIIEAHKEQYKGSEYTSARLVSRGKQSWGPGHRIAIRAKLPSGRGTWPAIWMLADNLTEVGWPMGGEIDIMEHVGYSPDSLFGTVHTQAFNHILGTQDGGSTTAKDLETNFHIYSIDWYADHIDFQLDGRTYHTFHKRENATVEQWPFDTPQHLLLNLAVGGSWGGRKGIDDTIWPQRMVVDWVRVYQHK